MSQQDYIISDQSGTAFLSDLNAHLGAIVSQNSGATEPAVMYAYMTWADTTSGWMKQRNAANTGWVNVYRLSDAGIAWGQIISGKPTTVAGYGITDINNYAPTLGGTGASGTWGINISGNAATATLATTATTAISANSAPANAGEVVGVANYSWTVVALGTVTIPWDDTIPQITEGSEYATLVVNPLSATNKLRIDINVSVACSSSDNVTVALFRDAVANALAACTYTSSANFQNQVTLTHHMDAGTTSPITFRLRMGSNGPYTVTNNGSGGGRKYGGVCMSSITVTQYKA